MPSMMKNLYKTEQRAELNSSLDAYLNRALSNCNNLFEYSKLKFINPSEIIAIVETEVLSEEYLQNYTKKYIKSKFLDKAMFKFLLHENKICKIITSTGSVGWINFCLLELI